MLVKISLFLLFVLLSYYIIKRICDYQKKTFVKNIIPMKLVVLVKNQEEGIEFFIRRIMAERHRYARGIELVVVDIASSDDTPQILSRMSSMFNFQLTEISEENENCFKKAYEENGNPTFYYDARGMSGLELARAPLFQHLLTQRER